jgi:hypothetical protein
MSAPEKCRSAFADSAKFAAAKHKLRWLIDDLLLSDQPVVIGGPKKTLKTSVAVDLAVSLGTATPFLGSFAVPTKVCVAFISGEGGEAVIRTTAERICRAKDLALSDCAVHWSFRLPKLADPSGLRKFGDQLEGIGAKVVVIDPLYLCLLAGTASSASNLYEVGSLLNGFASECLDVGATPVFVHHATKSSAKNAVKNTESPVPIDLDDLAFCGVSEFVRQWILLGRREPFRPGSGRHQLLMSAGGNAGHSGFWNVDVDEGVLKADLTGRRWKVSVEAVSDGRKSRSA